MLVEEGAGVYLLGANGREGATQRAEEPVTPQGPGLSSGTRKGEGGRVRKGRKRI